MWHITCDAGHLKHEIGHMTYNLYHPFCPFLSIFVLLLLSTSDKFLKTQNFFQMSNLYFEYDLFS